MRLPIVLSLLVLSGFGNSALCQQSSSAAVPGKSDKIAYRILFQRTLLYKRLADEAESAQNPAFKPPETVSHSTVETRVLEEALNCATNNRSVGGPAQLATLLGGRSSLNVSYFYGKYMPQQDAEMLTVAIYSENDRRGYLFDMSFDGGKYFIANLPQLRKSKKQWQVGEINGGMWSFTRLWYLAQEIGARPRQRVAISEILRAAPRSCKAMNE
jgi:hypothetical protein